MALYTQLYTVQFALISRFLNKQFFINVSTISDKTIPILRVVSSGIFIPLDLDPGQVVDDI